MFSFLAILFFNFANELIFQWFLYVELLEARCWRPAFWLLSSRGLRSCTLYGWWTEPIIDNWAVDRTILQPNNHNHHYVGNRPNYRNVFIWAEWSARHTDRRGLTPDLQPVFPSMSKWFWLSPTFFLLGFQIVQFVLSRMDCPLKLGFNFWLISKWPNIHPLACLTFNWLHGTQNTNSSFFAG